MWVATVTKAHDLEQSVIVTDRTASKYESGDAQHYADVLLAAGAAQEVAAVPLVVNAPH